MADIHPFAAYRYNLDKVGKLESVIAPPYDVIDDALSEKLHNMNDFNVVRLILDPIKPTDDDTNNRYTRTAATLNKWIAENVLAKDSEPQLYAYSQTFEWEGETFVRRGFMGRIRLEKFGEGHIYPHEETMSGPKADRLKLFHATGMNLSQIFGLYPDDTNDVANTLFGSITGKPLEAVDHLGVLHQLWPVSDPTVIKAVQELMQSKPIFIADGHHRYETSCRHLEERQAAGKVAGPDAPENFTLMMMVGMNEPGLKVMPTHRLVSGMGSPSAEQVKSLLEKDFDVEVMGTGAEVGKEVWKRIEASNKQEVLGFCTVKDKTWLLATGRSPKTLQEIVPEHSEIWRGLGVSILHKLALEHSLSSIGTPSCKYVHLEQEVIDAVEAGTCELACLVQPATVDHIRSLAGTFEKMPAKSTYFYPKLASGLLFNPIHTGR